MKSGSLPMIGVIRYYLEYDVVFKYPSVTNHFLGVCGKERGFGCLVNHEMEMRKISTRRASNRTA
jgi:hypothetical protein